MPHLATPVVRPVARVAAVVVLAGAALISLPQSSSAAPKLQITTVSVAAPGPDTKKNVNGEFVKIKNVSKASVSMKGYTLRDQSKHVYTFGAFTLKPGKTVTVYSGKGKNTASKRYWGSTWHIWNNSGGDKATLKAKSGSTLDSCSWKTVSDKVRYASC